MRTGLKSEGYQNSKKTLMVMYLSAKFKCKPGHFNEIRNFLYNWFQSKPVKISIINAYKRNKIGGINISFIR